MYEVFNIRNRRNEALARDLERAMLLIDNGEPVSEEEKDRLLKRFNNVYQGERDPLGALSKNLKIMLNLVPSDIIHYKEEQQKAIDDLIINRGSRTGKEMWDDKGPNDIFVEIKNDIRSHCLNIQKVRCAYCETLLEYGAVQIEHFANKGRYQQFLYEPLNLVCSCPVCNGFAKKGTRNSIKGVVNPNYADNDFIYVHPYLDDVSKEIKYKGIFKIRIDREHSSDKGKATIDMFNWDTEHATLKRLGNLIVRPTSSQRRKMISEILNHK